MYTYTVRGRDCYKEFSYIYIYMRGGLWTFCFQTVVDWCFRKSYPKCSVFARSIVRPEHLTTISPCFPESTKLQTRLTPRSYTDVVRIRIHAVPCQPYIRRYDCILSVCASREAAKCSNTICTYVRYTTRRTTEHLFFFFFCRVYR